MGSSIIESIQSRVSSPRLMAPAPDAQTLDRVYKCALRAPDHMMLRPWRYLVIEAPAREALGQLFAESALKEDASLTERQLDKYRAMPMRAPMMIVAVSKNIPHAKVPTEEQVVSCGAGVAYMLLALQSEGFGGVWRTGPLAENRHLKASLNIAEYESIVGFLYMGTPCGDLKAVPVIEPESHFQPWRPAE